MKTSVILTSHNYGRFLTQCVESVLNQTDQEWELIVVDDGSTDDTKAVLDAYAKDVRVTIHRLDGVGLAAAANHGIRQGKGMYILRLDADDFLDPHSIALLAAFLDRHPDVGLVYPDHFRVNEEGAFLGYTRTMDLDEGSNGIGRPPLPGGALCRKVCYEMVGGYNETLCYQEDYDFWLRLTARYKVAALHLPLLYYRQHAGSMSRNVASRAEARRYVKRTYASHAIGGRPLRTLVVIPADWPGEPARSQRRLCAPLGDSTLLDRTLRLLPSSNWEGEVVVVGKDPILTQACAARGVPVIAWPDMTQTVTGWPAPLEFLRSVASALEPSANRHWDLAILLSPYCPFRHSDRLTEVMDTMVIHDCDLVLSIGADVAHVWKERAKGLTSPESEGQEAGGTRLVREAGELWGARREVLDKHPALDTCRVGYVELLAIEEWTVKDELSARVCEDLLAAGPVDYLTTGAALRSKGER